IVYRHELRPVLPMELEIVKLEKIEKECENDHKEAFKSLDSTEKTNPNQADTINELKNLQCADQLDSGFAKQLHKKTGQIVILGFHNAGKTTLSRTLQDNSSDEYTSSLSSRSSHLWKHYIPSVDSIIFLVDAIDPIRFAKATAELEDLLKNENVFNIPIVIPGSKSDSQKAVDEESFLPCSTWFIRNNETNKRKHLLIY
ncbi:unnamed protein product, partial [Rotaria socialis]